MFRSAVAGPARFVSGASFLLASLMPLAASAADISIIACPSCEQATEAGSTLSFRVSRLPDAGEGDLYLIVANIDVTPLLRVEDGNRLLLDTETLALPAGRHRMTLFLVSPDGHWSRLAQDAFTIADAPYFDEAETNPQLTIGNKGQIDEGHAGDAFAPDRRVYQDLTLQGGLTSQHRRGDQLSLRSRFEIVGSTAQEDALQYSDKLDDAPKLDLSDYLVELDAGDVSLAAGSIQLAVHPLLVNDISQRGLSGRYRLNERLDISLASVNGTSIVGFSNILGQESRDHNISVVAIGYELLAARPGGLRLELSYLDATIRSVTDFDVGEVTDAETNQGLGLRLSGSNESGRLRGDLSIARSRYRNPNDPLLAQGDDIVDVVSTSDIARHLEISYDLIQDADMTESIPLALTLSFRHERADPLYRSVAAFIQADQLRNQISADARIGAINAQLQYARSRDNLDDVATILTTRTRDLVANLSLPLSELLSGVPDSPSWWPLLSYSYNRVHQFAGNDPDAATSGFNGGSHLPDQVTASHGVGLQWTDELWSLEYRVSLNDQDNRQPGREDADFQTLTQDLNLSFQVSDALNLGASFSYGTNADHAQQIDLRTRSWELVADWAISDQWAFSGNLSETRSDDSQDLATSDSLSASSQINWNFSLPMGQRELPGQLFIAYTRETSKTDDRFFDFQSGSSSWAINSGINLTLF